MRLALSGMLLVLLAAGDVAAQQWVKCASEDGYCFVNGTAVVQYGAGDKWAKRNATGRIFCSYKVFGDPAVGVHKACYVQASAATGVTGNPPKWVSCSKDYGFCRFKGTRPVMYGHGSKWLSRLATDGIKCVPESFGQDPAPGIEKTCYFDSANVRR
jgi:hypothetical protein